MPPGSRRAVITPASAVRVSRSPPDQPSALVTVRSAIRPGGVDAADPVDHILGRRRHGLGVRQGQRPTRGGPGPLPGLRNAGRRDEGSEKRRGHGCLPAGRRAGTGRRDAGDIGSAAGVLKRGARAGEAGCAWKIPRQFECPSHHSEHAVAACSSDVRFGEISPICVSEGGLEPPCPFGALAPQASASAYSATRTGRCCSHRLA